LTTDLPLSATISGVLAPDSRLEHGFAPACRRQTERNEERIIQSALHERAFAC